jgi:hypothetical protein
VRAVLAAFLDSVFIGAAWAGFALLGLAAVMWLLDWGHLLGPIGNGEPSRATRWVAILGACLLVGGLVGVLVYVRG